MINTCPTCKNVSICNCDIPDCPAYSPNRNNNAPSRIARFAMVVILITAIILAGIITMIKIKNRVQNHRPQTVETATK